MSYKKDFSKIFANISIFPLINFEVTLIFVFVFRAIDFILLNFFSIKINHGFNFFFFESILQFCFDIFSELSVFRFPFFYFKKLKCIALFLSLIFYYCYLCISKRIVIFYLSKTLLEGLFNFLF